MNRYFVVVVFILVAILAFRLQPHLAMRHRLDSKGTPSPFFRRATPAFRSSLPMLLYFAFFYMLVGLIILAGVAVYKGLAYAQIELQAGIPWYLIMCVASASDSFFEGLAREAEGTETQLEAILRRLPQMEGNQRGLQYEWGNAEWPKWSDEAPRDKAWVPYDNPRPYTSLDAYAVALLRAETVASADARGTRIFLERAYQTLGAYLPEAVCDVIVKHPDAFVRAWAASHIHFTLDYHTLLQNDLDPFVRASLLCNPENKERCFGWGGFTHNWKGILSALSQIERLAMMKSPDLNIRVPLALMKEAPTEFDMEESEYTEIVSVAVLNPNLIERSRRQGRSYYLTWGSGESPMEEFAEMWELAATTWLRKHPVPYRVFAFIQTKASVKLDIFRRLAGKENEFFREAIVNGCDLSEDRELLKLALDDEGDLINEAANMRCGAYSSYVRKSRSQNRSAATRRVGKRSETVTAVKSPG